MCRRPTVILAVLSLLCLAAIDAPAYVTPGSGITWSMDDLVAHAGGAVTGGGGLYQVHQSIVVSVNDRLQIAPGESLEFIDTSGTIGLEIRGALSAVGTGGAMIRFDAATPAPGAWRGLSYNDTQAGSEFHLAWCEIAHAHTAIDVVGADVLVESCDLHHSLEKVIDLSAAGGVIRGCHLHDNRRRTITMTLSSSPLIEYCRMENNNLDNTSPYPYVNIGLQGTNSPLIRGCTILGSGHQMSGGISVWASSNGLIERNHIEGCGYGILCYQAGASPTIRGNVLLANNIHPDTLNWGFGIACNGPNAPVVAGNIIRGHGYGVAIINGGQPNLGDLGNASTDDDGGNHIAGNGLSRIYGLYNNTPLPQMAQGNWWGGASAAEVEEAVYHQPDNPSLGLVDYSGWLLVDAAPEPLEPPFGADGPRRAPALRACPNPFDRGVRLDWKWSGNDGVSDGASDGVSDGVSEPGANVSSVSIFDLNGRRVRRLAAGPAGSGAGSGSGAASGLWWDGRDERGTLLPGGVYLVRGEIAGRGTVEGRVVRLPSR